MKILAGIVVVVALVLFGAPAPAQEAATETFSFPAFNFPTDATGVLDASEMLFTTVPQGLLLANQGFMALRSRQFDAAIGFYTQAAQLDPKYTDMLEYTKGLRDRFAVFPDGPVNVAEERLPSQWGEDHPMEIWARVKVKFWLGWFKSVLPRDQAAGGPQGPQYMYDIPQDPNQMRVPPPVGPAIPGADALPATQIQTGL